jgi:predicted nucleotidyltransferase
MNRSLEEKRAEVSVLCRRYRVRKLAVFGSALRAEFEPGRSDVDLLAEFEPMPPAEHARAYLDLAAALEHLLGARVDLTEVSAIRNPYIRREILETQQAIYAA